MSGFDRSLKLLFVSTPIAPLGSGIGGGVEITLRNLAVELQRRGHDIQVFAPQGSIDPALSLIEIAGLPQVPAQTQDRDHPVLLPANACLANMWEYARRVQQDYDLIVNFAYDWLPFYLTPFFQRPIAHLVSMGSLTEAMDHIVGQVATDFSGTVAVHTNAQAETFPFAQHLQVVGNAIDLAQYTWCGHPEDALAWVGRIAPEKGLEDAVAAAEATGTRLKILGVVQDSVYWDKIQQDYPNAPISYLGFVPTEKLQEILGTCRALLCTPHWVEAFGNVAVEALACGVPVIAYRRGGPGEIVEDGRTGWLVEPDSVSGLIEAIGRVDQISRATCRERAEARFSLAAMGDRAEAWFRGILDQGFSPSH